MKHRLECTVIWSTRVSRSLKTKRWVCTAQFGMLTTGRHKVVGSKPTGPMLRLSHPTGHLRSMVVNVRCPRRIPITQSGVLPAAVGGINQYCRSWMCIKATSLFGWGRTIWFMTTAVTPAGFRRCRWNASTTVTSGEVGWGWNVCKNEWKHELHVAYFVNVRLLLTF